MKHIFFGCFLTIILSQSVIGMELSTHTADDHQKLRNQLAFAYACQNNTLEQHGYLFTDGSTNLNYMYEDPNIKNVKRTQLSMAARTYIWPVTTDNYYQPQVIEWFINNKANLNLLDNTGRSAALWSIGSYQGEDEHPIALFLNTKLIDINQIFDITNISDFFQTYVPKVCLLTAAVLNKWDVFGRPEARYNLVRTLLKFNPNRDLAPNGKTALEIAQYLGDAEMVKILQEK